MSSPYAYMDFWATHVVTMVRTMRGDNGALLHLSNMLIKHQTMLSSLASKDLHRSKSVKTYLSSDCSLAIREHEAGNR